MNEIDPIAPMRFYRDKRVLVTGGTGLIGRELVEALLASGAKVRVSCSRAPVDPLPDVEYRVGDLMDGGVCAALAHGMEFVFHLASVRGSVGVGRKHAADFFVQPLLMNTHIMEESRKAGAARYLFTSSVCVYAPAAVFVEDRAWDQPPHPSDAFAGWAKRMGEMQALAYREQWGWGDIAIVRPVNVYGPYDDFDPATAQVIPALIARVESGEAPLRVWGDGTAVRDFLYSRDAARGLLLAMEKAADCVPVNLGSGTGHAIREVVEAVLEASGRKPDVLWDTGKPTGEKSRVADTTRAREKLGFMPQVGLKQGIARALEWYRRNKNRKNLRVSHFSAPLA